jgi:hypothetical protein
MWQYCPNDGFAGKQDERVVVEIGDASLRWISIIPWQVPIFIFQAGLWVYVKLLPKSWSVLHPAAAHHAAAKAAVAAEAAVESSPQSAIITRHSIKLLTTANCRLVLPTGTADCRLY